MTQAKPAKKDEKKEKNPFGDLHKGEFHKWLGKKPGEPITDKDIERGLRSPDPHVRKMAQFAKNSRKFKHPKKDEKKASGAPKKAAPKKALEEIASNPPAYTKW